ncbi:beta-ketoacyl-ACP synthase III [Nocardia sp. NRRL S-836]|uniref:beta-ketoacyl-ACP synthase III n=1 Tax=Nocardia sp. NRRL S-836 TaxID=1519492 RepID=UPI0006ADE74E|nr:beta-ketoacyl-ACP synthase III [Nocardia sp. NRRL S-836]
MTNAELSQRLDTTDRWIRSRTGIAERRRADGKGPVLAMATSAGAAVLEVAGHRTVDLVLVATSSPDRPSPAVAPQLASRLGLGFVPAFDISAVCSGFLYATNIASSLIRSGAFRSILIVASEAYSRIVDPDDRATSVIFGDGAGAALVVAGGTASGSEVLAEDWGSDGDGCDLLQVGPAGGDVRNYFSMSGREVYLRAIETMSTSVRAVSERCSWHTDEIDVLVPHQANRRIIEAVAKKLSMPADRAVVSLEKTGNTAAASIPLALAHAMTTGMVRAGDRVVMTAFGGGLTWASTALRWGEVGLAEVEL